MQQGYKQTEVGVIPTDWDVCTLETLYNITSSKRVFQSQWRKSGIPFYRAREIAVMSEGKNAPEDLYIDTNLYDLYTRQYGSIKKDDVLITGVGTLGKVYVVKEKDRFYFKDGNIIWLQTKGGFSSQYLKHQYDMPVLINQVFGNAGGSTVATYTITNAKVTKVPVPPLEEQNRIAEALSDVDSMISSLEKLITKKKALKQGAMQELLTGKKRLPGFTGEWKQYKLDDLLKYEQPTKYIVQSTEYSEQGVPVLTAGKSLVLGYTVETAGIYENLPVIIFDDFVTSSKYIDFRFKVKSSAMKMLTLRNAEMNLKLIFELIQMIDFSPVDHQRHWISQYSQFKIKMPSDIKEQEAIASILSDMDNEIKALEQKLAKTCQLKQGMMQQLLTGKIRLV